MILTEMAVTKFQTFSNKFCNKVIVTLLRVVSITVMQSMCIVVLNCTLRLICHKSCMRTTV